MNYYYIGKDNQRKGPISRQELLSLHLHLNTFVWRKGLKDWIQFKQLPEFREYIEDYTSTRARPILHNDISHSVPTTPQPVEYQTHTTKPNNNSETISSPNEAISGSTDETSALTYLLYSILCFIGCGVGIWMIFYLFSPNSHVHRIKAAVFIFPLYMAWYGFKNLFYCVKTIVK